MLIDPDVQLTAEPKGYEYGYYAFDNIDPIETQIEINEITNRKNSRNPIKMPNKDIVLPIKNDKIMELQPNDKFCKHIINMLKCGKLHANNPCYIEKNVLKRYIEDKQRFEVVVLPQTLTGPDLQLAHEGLGHNGIPQNICLVKMTILLERIEAFCDKTCKTMHVVSKT